MKELSIEEKAKRYDNLLVKLQEAKVDNSVCDERYCCVIDDIVPELKESEDEKVIRDIKVVLECSATKFFKEEGKMPIWYDRAVAWLEKQGEHNYTWKPSDKQMGALNIAIGEANAADTAAGDEAAEILTSLYQELKKLREE